jgi:Flp pilus assembly protein TadG
MIRPVGPRPSRRGIAVVELAIILPLLVFLFLVVIDYCRLFYFSQIVTGCARNGALWAGDPYAPAHSLYPDLTSAAQSDAPSSMSGDLTVRNDPGSDSSGNYVRVTVTYPFKTLTQYPGIPNTITVTRTVQTRLAPAAPQ